MSVIDESLSKRIKSLRFLLIVFVVFIHNNPQFVNFAGGTEIYTIPAYVNLVRTLISGIICSVAVPLFFLIAGFLLYAKETAFLPVLKKRSMTILLPYIVWNVLAILFFFTAQSFAFTKPYFANIIVRNFNAADWFGAFTGKSGFFGKEGYPLVYQFWFLRDLFILTLLFIPIKKIIDKFPFAAFVLFFTLWISGINIYIVNTGALLFFAMGYYIVKYNLQYKEIDSNIEWGAGKTRLLDVGVIYILTIIAELFLKEQVPIIHILNILVGCVFFIKLSYYFIKNEWLYDKLARFEKYAFFVYAVHGIALAVMQKLSVKIIPMHDAWLLVQYFAVNILGIILFTTIAVVLRKLFPRFYALLTGGRL
jgi:hypothetical protein